MAENNRKNGSVPRLGLLKIDGNGSEQNEEARPRSRVNDTDSDYVRMAKTGGHASKFCKLQNHNLLLCLMLAHGMIEFFIVLCWSRSYITL